MCYNWNYFQLANAKIQKKTERIGIMSNYFVKKSLI